MPAAVTATDPRPLTETSFERFEALLLEVSTRFVDLPAEALFDQIEDAQRRVCDYLGLDRSTLWQPPPDASGTLVLTHVYQPASAPPPPSNADAQLLFPWILSRLRRGETTVLADINDLPPEAGRDTETFRSVGTRSTVVVPMMLEHTVVGALSFATVHEYRTWSPEFVRGLQLLAQVFAGAITRASDDRILRERERQLRLAASEWRATFDAISDSVLLIDHERTIVRANAAAAAALDIPLEQIVGNRCYSLFHGAAAPVAACPLSRAIESGATQEAEILDEHRGVCCHYSVNPMPRASRHGHAAICVVKDITPRKRVEENLRQSLGELQRLRDQLHEQNVYLRQEVRTLSRHSRLIGGSAALARVLEQVEQVAPTGATVLLLGETGTGKELIASEIHELSRRRDRLMVRVNCSAIPATLIEGELFGRERGAYTGALSRQIGRFEMAHGSTLFLDEIGELPIEIQVKLLRALQEKQVERLGSPKPIAVDVRIIAATNRDLERLVREGRFRQDLYYRLNVFPIHIPPLRERREDIPPLVSALVDEFGAALGKSIEAVAKENMKALQGYDWPGNVRELRNVVERAMIVASGPKLWIDPPRAAGPVPSADQSARAVERAHILRVLEQTGGRIRGVNGAAAILQLKPTTLESRMARLEIPTRRQSPRTK